MRALASPSMPRRLPPGCIEDRDRHGNVRIYFRAKGGPKIRLRETPWTPEFMVEYDAAKGEAVPKQRKGITPGTWRWLCVRYFAECADYLQLDDRMKRVRRGILEATFDEPISPGSSKFFRDFPLSRMGADAIEVLRDRKLAFPEGANNRVKAIRAVFKWAVRKKGPDGKPLVSHNVAREVPYLKSNNPSGYPTWTLEDVRQFEARHPIGTKVRLALALLLFTGQRRSDITRLGRQHVRSGKITFTQFKGRNRKPKRLGAASAARGNRRLPVCVPYERSRTAVHGCRIRKQVPRVVRPSGPSSLRGARTAQSRRHHRGQQRRDRASTNGDLRLGNAENGGSIHTHRRSTTLGTKRNAYARIVRTKRHRIVSHRTTEWDFFGKKPC
jgi:integrase